VAVYFPNFITTCYFWVAVEKEKQYHLEVFLEQFYLPPSDKKDPKELKCTYLSRYYVFS